jgi:hypothetical protein
MGVAAHRKHLHGDRVRMPERDIPGGRAENEPARGPRATP